MIRVADIHPLSHFLRDHKAHMERLASTGRPEVLTVNGEARIVVQDAESYQKLLDAADDSDGRRIVRERAADVDRGEPGIPASEVLDEMRKILGRPRK